MGMSPEATLFYGYIGRMDMKYAEKPHSLWGPESGDEGYDEDEDQRDVYADDLVDEIVESMGGVKPYKVAPYTPEFKALPPGPEKEAIAADIEARRAIAQEAWDEIAATFGADKVRSGSNGYDEFSGQYLYIKDSKVSAEWSDVGVVTSFEVDPSWSEALDLFIDRLEVYRPGLQGPGWFVVSSYG